MSESFGRVALFGLGASTQATGDYLLALPDGKLDSLTVYAGTCPAAAHAIGDELAARGAEVIYDTEEINECFDLGVISPGIPAVGTFFHNAQAACHELISEPELAWRITPEGWIAITGTNGKTTTTSLTAELLRRAGAKVQVVGNIGLPPIACVAERTTDELFVAELSSFQIHSMVRFAPQIAVLLNILADHLEWHGTMDAYIRDKEHLFAAMKPGELAVLGDDEFCRPIGERLRRRGLRTVMLGKPPDDEAPDAAWIDADGVLCVRLGGVTQKLCHSDELGIQGSHNIQNALAAATVALAQGAAADAVADGLKTFAPLEHRVEPCGEVAGVTYINDSKATNVDAADAALSVFEPGHIIMLLGGHDKGSALDAFARDVTEHCKAAIAYGEAGPRIYEALQTACADTDAGCTVLSASTMRDAFDAAVCRAEAGDVVLLSPACSSFDEFSGYEERGRTFREWVAELAVRQEERTL